MGGTIEMTRLSGMSLLLAGCILCFGAACGDDADRGGLAALTSEELSEYHSAIDSLGETAGFELLRPTYLPAGTDWLPSTDYIADFKSATLTFYPLESAEPTSKRLVIHIAQENDPDELVCPPCSGRDRPNLERYLLGATELVLKQGQSGESALFLMIYFRHDDIRVAANFDWQFEPGGPSVLTDDMRAEALKVVQSMLD
jgi:hypothetical protein